MQLLARAAQTLAAADEPEAALDRVLDGVARDLGPIATIERGEGMLAVTWHDGVHGEDRDTFAETLAAIANLAHRSHGGDGTGCGHDRRKRLRLHRILAIRLDADSTHCSGVGSTHCSGGRLFGNLHVSL